MLYTKGLFYNFMIIHRFMSSFQGYSLKKRNFFKYFHYILAYGFIGTLIQFALMTILIYVLSGKYSLGVKEHDGSLVYLNVYECMLLASVLCAADEGF